MAVIIRHIRWQRIENLLSTLEDETSVILDWFRINEMKSNDDKCNLIVAKNENLSIKLGNELIESCYLVDLLGITIDNELKFNEQICLKREIKNSMLWPESLNIVVKVS